MYSDITHSYSDFRIFVRLLNKRFYICTMSKVESGRRGQKSRNFQPKVGKSRNFSVFKVGKIRNFITIFQVLTC